MKKRIYSRPVSVALSEDMFQQIANTLMEARIGSRMELQSLDQSGFKVHAPEEGAEDSCAC